MAGDVDCLFCKGGTTRKAEGESLVWTCPYCGEFWTTQTVAELGSWETAFLSGDRLRNLRLFGMGSKDRPITPQDLGL